MGRKSSIERSPEEVRTTIERLIRQRRLTLDEIVTFVESQHGEGASPSRSAIGRYAKSVEVMMGRMRDIDTASRAIVEELGESPDDKAGALLVQSITTAAIDVSMRMQDAGDGDEGERVTSIEDVRKLARAGSDIIRMRKVNRQERQEIAELAREKLLAEQKANLDKVGRKRGMSAETQKEILNEILGVPS